MRAGMLLIALTVVCTSLSAKANERLGIVLLHGKTGLPQQMTPLAQTLNAQGWLTDQPEMCWSHNRIYDRVYRECLAEIDAAIARLKQNGANGASGIVLLGMSLGGNGVLGYAANHPGLRGVITLAPAHAPEFISGRPEIIASLNKARDLIAKGQGDARTAFADVNTRTAAFTFQVMTTAKIYLSFFAPDSEAILPANAAKLTAPLLYVAGNNDPTQRGRGYIFDRVPAHPLNRYVTVASDHIGTPAASQTIVVNWLKELAAP
jgi:pimeloyl-ACP methyl ester carboxylesterase